MDIGTLRWAGSRIATLFEQVRRETDGAVVALDNGDTFHGTSAAVHGRGDGMVGLRVAIIGLACPIVDKTMPPAFSEGLRFTIGHEELPRWIAHVRSAERADLVVVVVLSHLGFAQDVKMAREVDGIDVLVSGHTHNRIHRPAIENGVVIFQSGCHGSFVGRLDVEVADGRIAGHRHEPVEIDENKAQEPSMLVRAEALMAPHRKMLARDVGETVSTPDRYSVYEHRWTTYCSTPSRRRRDAISHYPMAGAAEALRAHEAGSRPSADR